MIIARVLILTTALIAGAVAVSGSHAAHGHLAAAPVPRATAAAVSTIPDDKLLGQRIMVGMDGTSPSASLLRSVRAGHVGSVILFSPNIVSRSQLRGLTGALQSAARAGGNPPLLIATDQEGGQVKRLSHGPPTLSPPQMAATGSSTVAYRQGVATGHYLRGLGINWDLAPVLDVPTFARAFIWTQGRAFSFSAARVAQFGTQFALGLQHAGAAATGKHFPGVGSAAVDTDNRLDELRPTARQRAAALLPYRSLIPRGLDSVMLSTAGFPAYDHTGAPAALSSAMATGLLRRQLHFGGVSITDALGTPTGHNEVTAGVLAARAGADVLLYTDSAPGELAALESAVRSGRVSRSSAEASYSRIVALKRRVTGR